MSTFMETPGVSSWAQTSFRIEGQWLSLSRHVPAVLIGLNSFARYLLYMFILEPVINWKHMQFKSLCFGDWKAPGSCCNTACCEKEVCIANKRHTLPHLLSECNTSRRSKSHPDSGWRDTTASKWKVHVENDISLTLGTTYGPLIPARNAQGSTEPRVSPEYCRLWPNSCQMKLTWYVISKPNKQTSTKNNKGSLGS